MFQTDYTGQTETSNASFNSAGGAISYQPVMSKHAQKRAGQRRISAEAIEAALTYGTVTYRTGAVFSTLLTKDVRKARIPSLREYVGTTVLASSKENVVITVYRNPKAISKIKKLSKRGRGIY